MQRHDREKTNRGRRLSRSIAGLAVLLATVAGCAGSSDQAHRPSTGGSAPTGSTSSGTPPPSASPTTAAATTAARRAVVPAGWVTHQLGTVSVATPRTWAVLVARHGKLVGADVSRIEAADRKQMLQDLTGDPGALAILVDTRTLRSFLDHFFTGIYVGVEPLDTPFSSSAELAQVARDEDYAGAGAPPGVKVSTFAHPAVPAIQARYTSAEGGHKALEVEYTLAFSGTLVHLDLSTDIRKPGPDIATAERIVRTATTTP